MSERIKIEKINDKVETVEVRGQGCWDDCEIWKNNTTAAITANKFFFSIKKLLKNFNNPTINQKSNDYINNR